MKSTVPPTFVSRPRELPTGASKPDGNGLSSTVDGTALSGGDWMIDVVRENPFWPKKPPADG